MVESKAFRRLRECVETWDEGIRREASPCSGCKAPLNTEGGLRGEVAAEGDLSICAYCGTFHVYTATLALAPLSAEEFAALPADIQGELEEGRDLLRAAQTHRWVGGNGGKPPAEA